jgi:hypothetical protein
MKRKALQVTFEVRKPSVVELTVGEKVQLDRLTPSRCGYVAERRGDLLEPGVTMLALEQGVYFFKTLSEANLKVVSGSVALATTSGGKHPWPDPPMHTTATAELLAPSGAGDEPAGEAPRLTLG